MVKSLGGWMDFVPMYHPEFKYIEIYWGYVKCKVRNECNYNWHKLIDHVPEDLDSVLLIFMRRAFIKCCRYIDIYTVGLTTEQVEFYSKKYNNHCSIPAEFKNNL